MNNSIYITLICFLLAYVLTSGGLWAWRTFRKTGNGLPVTEKIHRGPGDMLRKQIALDDQRLIFHILGSALVPLLFVLFILWITSSLSPQVQFWVTIGMILPLGGALYFSARWLNTIISERSDRLLGYFGERVVGEALDELRFRGFSVFHNVPANEANPTFHIGHIVLGTNGIYLIDTHTVPRGVTRPGLEGHRVVFDGQQLIFPWGEDVKRINHTREQTAWLENWVIQALGTKVPIMAIMVFPGWWVDELALGHVRVVNPKQITSLMNRNVTALNEEQLGILCRELDARCRDIES